MIISIPEITICAPEIISDVPSIIVCIVGKIESLTALIALRMEILDSHPSTISDDVELTVTQTELADACLTSGTVHGNVFEWRRSVEADMSSSHGSAIIVHGMCMYIEMASSL